MKSWVQGKMAEEINRNFVTIRDLYREDGVYYAKEMFDLDNKNAIDAIDDVIESLIRL